MRHNGHFSNWEMNKKKVWNIYFLVALLMRWSRDFLKIDGKARAKFSQIFCEQICQNFIESKGQKVGPDRECSKLPSISGGLVYDGFSLPKSDNCATKWLFYPQLPSFYFGSLATQKGDFLTCQSNWAPKKIKSKLPILKEFSTLTAPKITIRYICLEFRILMWGLSISLRLFRLIKDSCRFPAIHNWCIHHTLLWHIINSRPLLNDICVCVIDFRAVNFKGKLNISHIVFPWSKKLNFWALLDLISFQKWI